MIAYRSLIGIAALAASLVAFNLASSMHSINTPNFVYAGLSKGSATTFHFLAFFDFDSFATRSVVFQIRPRLSK
jgi:hypothetical protein